MSKHATALDPLEQDFRALADELRPAVEPAKPQEPRPKQLDDVIKLHCHRCNSDYEVRWYPEMQIWFGRCKFQPQCGAPCAPEPDIEQYVQTRLSELTSELNALTAAELTQYEAAIQQATQEALDAYVREHRQEYEDQTRKRIKGQLYLRNIEIRREELRGELYAKLKEPKRA